MLYFFNVRVNPKDMSQDELWDLWEQEADAAVAAREAGKVVSLYKVAGQRRVLGILDVESHDELDRILMAVLPMAHNLEFEQILPVRVYDNFHQDLKERWKSALPGK